VVKHTDTQTMTVQCCVQSRSVPTAHRAASITHRLGMQPPVTNPIPDRITNHNHICTPNCH